MANNNVAAKPSNAVQSWSSQQAALKQTTDDALKAVSNLQKLYGVLPDAPAPNLTATQTRTLEQAYQRHLEAGAALTAFVTETPTQLMRLASQADAIAMDTSRSLFDRDIAQKTSARLNEATSEFMQAKTSEGWKSPATIEYKVGNYELFTTPTGIAQRIDTSTWTGRAMSSWELFKNDVVGQFDSGAKTVQDLRDFGIKVPNDYEVCVSLMGIVKGKALTSLFPAPDLFKDSPTLPGDWKTTGERVYKDGIGSVFKPEEQACKLLLNKNDVKELFRKYGQADDSLLERLDASGLDEITFTVPRDMLTQALATEVALSQLTGEPRLSASSFDKQLQIETSRLTSTDALAKQFNDSLGTKAIAVLADAGTGTVTDAGGGGADTSNQTTTPTNVAQPVTNAPTPDPTTSYTNYLNTTSAALTPAQQDTLAGQLQSLNLGGTDALSFITLPGGSTVIANLGGDIVGEITALEGGFTRLVSNRINEDGSIEPVTSYVSPSGQAANEADYQTAVDNAQYAQVGGALGLMNSIIGLQNWDSMSDLQRVAAVTSIYNVVDTMTGGNALPGNLGTAASALGLLNALDGGDIGGSIYSGLSLVENLTATTTLSASGAATTSGWVSANMPGGANFLPGLNLALAVISGDPVQMLSAAVAFIPVYGPIISIGITLLGGLFGGSERPDAPMSEGSAHAQWDAAGNTIVVTDQDTAGGGATAAGWMNQLSGALQTRLQSYSDAQGNGYGVVANMLPSIGFQYDPDNQGGMGSAQLILRWTDEAGMPQHRNYDRHGNRSDGSTIAGDFMTHAQGAIAPDWQVQTVFDHYSQGGGIELPTLQAGLPQALADGLQQSWQALTWVAVDLPVEPALVDSLVDIEPFAAPQPFGRFGQHCFRRHLQRGTQAKQHRQRRLIGRHFKPCNVGASNVRPVSQFFLGNTKGMTPRLDGGGERLDQWNVA